ncbi:hypothetical protein D8674_008496 [Pyrus ussuriensis x Pyrus communis]|uniref:Uncharacterized protein n=1 Tax=Pyrus ussuriensis x Pyrus communis TaxID=2448454 RepID=A0A5N5HVU5_9ROSA|nr:hypothetical protein D8674_008496 [Pyrus ussuriensis x Pyrus communis]
MHFQDEKYLKRVKANAINRLKKKILHHSSSRCFYYRMEEQRQINVATSQLPLDTPMEGVVLDPDPSLWIKTNTLDQTLGPRLGKVYRGMENACHRETVASSSSMSTGQVTLLKAQVASLK